MYLLKAVVHVVIPLLLTSTPVTAELNFSLLLRMSFWLRDEMKLKKISKSTLSDKLSPHQENLFP